ncbi:PREDICTED: uncharacterized protein LOC106330808 [Brassica oleracea var. oleracea]|uniref:uncharacterized protein LOC106330808 n=1 Tax=Brassica oleracea var. oleracea TaxID=109376 RepID=UPI0006A6DE06|nr:PREDICTED: uncharacterized protein LOC106330808 [Brassica oleracea var. oleracea]
MEHLAVHLADEAALGGPVQYRWMYPFERYMYHLKKKVKNKAHIGGSIVAQYVNKEISTASANFFGNPQVVPEVPLPGEVRFTYQYPDVPNLFYHEGRVSGKSEEKWQTDDDYTVLQIFLMLNCNTFEPYERMFEEFMMERNPYMSSNDLQILKDQQFAEWVKNYVMQASNTYEFPMWMLDFVQGPQRKYKSWPIYHSRGYCFHTHSHRQDMKTQHYGVQVRGTTYTDYYGLIEEIMMVEYFGSVGLKAMFVSFLIRGYDIHQPTIGGHVQKLCLEGFEKRLRMLLLRYKMIVVAQSVMLRIEAYVVEDDSDYESTPIVPPNDEYVSEDELDEACTDSDSESDSSS